MKALIIRYLMKVPSKSVESWYLCHNYSPFWCLRYVAFPPVSFALFFLSALPALLLIFIFCLVGLPY